MKARHYPLILALISLVLLTQTCTWETYDLVVWGLEMQGEIPPGKWYCFHVVNFQEDFHWPPGKITVLGKISNDINLFPSRLDFKVLNLDMYGYPVGQPFGFSTKVTKKKRLKKTTVDFPGWDIIKYGWLEFWVKPRKQPLEKGDTLDFKAKYNRLTF